MLLTHSPSTTLTQAIQLLAAKSPILATRAAKTLDILLQEVQSSPNSDAWQFSNLSKNGFPVEFTFSSLDSGIRYTTEVAGSEVKPQDKLDYALRLLNFLRAASLPNQTISRLRQAQSTGALDWGTWLGVRHRQDGDKYKLYTQIPFPASTVAQEIIQEFLGTEPLLPNHAAIPVAIGQEIGSSRIEFYFRINHLGLETAELHYLLQRFGLAEREAELLDFIATIRGAASWEQCSKLPEATYGFSISVGKPTVFSLFTFPGSLIGGDGKIRASVLSAAKHQGWDFDDYALMSGPIADWEIRNRHHNAIAFIVPPAGPLGLHISLSPPEFTTTAVSPSPSKASSKANESASVITAIPSLKTDFNSLHQAIATTQEFLLKAQHPDGFWSDFRLAPGASDEWVTGYVGTAIARSKTPELKQAALQAWHWLAQRRSGSLGWGYNAKTPADADSTLWALQLSDAMGCSDWAVVQRGQAFLSQHLRAGGGVTTYATAEPIQQFIGAASAADLAGWCSPHVCVTAAAAALPSLWATTRYFLRRQQTPLGHWQSYWWCEDAYATALAAEALSRSDEPKDGDRVRRAQQWAIQQIQANGSVTSLVCPNGSAFATAWIIRLLLLEPHSELMDDAIAQATHWLFNQQQPDGAWPASAGLRVPLPYSQHPSRQPHWQLHGLTEGSITLDQHRIFTTATVLQTLLKLAEAHLIRPSLDL